MTTSVILRAGDSRLEIIPQEGAVLAKFETLQQQVLAQTPWAQNVVPSLQPAADELSWVKNWRGGWQLCAPNTGSAASGTTNAAFHGAASQAEWSVTDQTSNSLTLSWSDVSGYVEMSRRWSISENGIVSAETSATNNSAKKRPAGFAEHLIFGCDFLEPVKHGWAADLEFCSAATIVELDYSGAPLELQPQKSQTRSDFTHLTSVQPAKVFAIANSQNKVISVEIQDWVARVEWQGLAHAMVWQEFGTSEDDPWNGQVFALGIEPTNVAHGLGANEIDGPFLLPGETISWKTSMHFFRKVDGYLEPAA